MLLLGLVLDDLEPLDLLLLDLVEAVHFGEQGVVHSGVRELLLEVLDPLLQRHAGLQLQDLLVDDPVDVMRLEEPEPESLPASESLMRDEALLRRLELLEEGHVLAPMPFISGPDEIGDGVFGDLEDLGEDLVGDVGCVPWRSDELPELDLDEIIYL